VSVATASRVVSGLDNVRSETRERVERAMRELLVRAARASPGDRMIGLLVPSLENPIFPALAQAMEERATEAGFASILCNTTAAAFREVDYVHMLLDRGADGMIFISCEMTNLSGDHDHYARLVDEGARIVFVNGALNTLSVPSVAVDERSAGELATQHLLDLGHERIGYVAGPNYYLPTQQKAPGREAALRAAASPPDGLALYAEDFSVEQGRATLRRCSSRSQRRPE
jgi:DNA-binding LacI/PurR family transcriptional regulator